MVVGAHIIRFFAAVRRKNIRHVEKGNIPLRERGGKRGGGFGAVLRAAVKIARVFVGEHRHLRRNADIEKCAAVGGDRFIEQREPVGHGPGAFLAACFRRRRQIGEEPVLNGNNVVDDNAVKQIQTEPCVALDHRAAQNDVVLEIRLPIQKIIAGQQRLPRQLRRGGKPAVFDFGNVLVRREPCRRRNRKQDQNEDRGKNQIPAAAGTIGCRLHSSRLLSEISTESAVRTENR